MNRVIELYRGCHTFIRSIPSIQSENPEAQIVIMGQASGEGYGPAPTEGTWKDQFLKEIKDKHDSTKVDFCWIT